MKTTIELPNATFRRAKVFAAERGMTLKRLVTAALEQHLGRHAGPQAQADPHGKPSCPPEPPWMAGFGELADLGDEHRSLLETIENEFEKLDPGDIP